MALVTEETTKEIIIPVATAAVGGFAAYTISETAPELVGLAVAAGAAWWVTR